ncbi:MAG: hydrogenase maturation protease [Dehalococcoidia bacterium]
MKTLVLGLGNPILSDDGVGIRVAQEVRKQLNNPRVAVAETSEAGLRLLDSILDYDEVVIIDAIQTQKGKAGQIYRMKPEDFSFAEHLSSPHQVNLATALELGKKLNLTMPQQITVFAVEANDVSNFGEKCTPEVERAIPEAVKMVLAELKCRTSS